MLKYSDIYDILEPITIVIFNESLQTFVYILPVGQCTPDKKCNVRKWRNASSVDIEPNNLMAYISLFNILIAFLYNQEWNKLGVKIVIKVKKVVFL